MSFERYSTRRGNQPLLLLLQSLGRHGVECAIHDERDVREEYHISLYVA